MFAAVPLQKPASPRRFIDDGTDYDVKRTMPDLALEVNKRRLPSVFR